MSWFFIVIAFMLGALFGIMMFCALSVSKDEERDIEQYKAGYSKGFEDGSKMD